MDTIIIGNRKLSKACIEVGKGHTTKINLIVGANSIGQVKQEKQKIDMAAKMGVHTIIDLSTVRLKEPLWQYGKRRYPHIAFGKVAPILVAMENNGNVTPENLLKEIEDAVFSGIDYMTLNLTPQRLSGLEMAKDRPFPTTSRQGAVLLNYMMRHGVDNPYQPILKRIFALFKEYRVTMHIGQTFRPVGITEANDNAHLWEISQQMEMYRLADEYGVQAIVEPVSHHPLGEISRCIENIRKKHGSYVPLQMLGPITTELNFDFDQYAAAIGAAEAARYNVGKITTIPPREHVGFPSLKDTMQGILATKIAVHTGDICRLPGLMEMDRRIVAEREKRKSCNPDSDHKGCNKCQGLCPLLLESTFNAKSSAAGLDKRMAAENPNETYIFKVTASEQTKTR